VVSPLIEEGGEASAVQGQETVKEAGQTADDEAMGEAGEEEDSEGGGGRRLMLVLVLRAP
jgi:hypothetical protein